MKHLLISLALLAPMGSVAFGECTEPGVCEGDVEEDRFALDICECYAYCFFNNACYGYTFSKSSGKCTLMNICATIEETDDCEDCVSGKFACAPETCSDDKCLIPVSYDGPAAQTTITKDVCECFQAATDFSALFYTFDSEKESCKLYLTAGASFEQCATCQTGTRECRPSNC